MSVPRELYLFFLANKQGQSYYVENSIVKRRLTPTWLPESPDGWMNTEISFARNSKYFGLNRSFTNPLKFVGDGATIIRHLFYTGKGIEQELFLLVNKWNDETGIYEPYYKGGVDLSKLNDDVAIGVTVNLLESGLLQLIKANENNVYEIPCDGSIPENIKVLLDGIMLRAKYNYSFINTSYQHTAGTNFRHFSFPVAFLNAEGDSVGVISANQEQAIAGTPLSSWFTGNPQNYIFSPSVAAEVTMKGNLTVRCTQRQGSHNNVDIGYAIGLPDGTSTFTVLQHFTDVRDDPTDLVVPINVVVTVPAGHHLVVPFIKTQLFNNNDQITLECQESVLSLEFNTRYQQTDTWGMRGVDLFRLLVAAATGGVYAGVSQLLEQYSHLVVTCGMALRKQEKAVIKTSLTEFFTSFHAILNGALGNEKTGAGSGEQLFFEKKEYVFDSSSVTLDLGEVSELKIEPALDYFFNQLKIGYPEQKYDEKQGQLEYNTTSQFSAPILTVKKELSLISKYRADSYGVEYTRFPTPGNNTVNNKSDNDVFILNAKPKSGTYSANMGTFGGAYGMGITGAAADIGFFVPGTKISISGSSLNDGNYIIQAASAFAGDVMLFVVEPLQTEVATITFQYGVRILTRENYSSITGLVNPESAYNIEDLTPETMLAKHGNYLRGVLHNQPLEYLKFLTADKNKELSRTLNGVTISEKANVQVGSLAKPLFYPYTLSFKTKVPMTFEQVMTGAANGHIHFTYNGVSIFGFASDVTVKPTLNDDQEWKLLISPMTNLSDLEDLEIDGLNYINQMGLSLFIPHSCPVQFVPEGKTLPPQYHFRHMDEWWHSEQVQKYVEKRDYAAPWQTSDTIELQFQTNGLGPVQIDVLKDTGELVTTMELDQVSDPSVILPQVLFEGSISLAGFNEGRYFLLVKAGTGDTIAQALSEPLDVRVNHDDTLLAEYYHTKNKQAIVFSTGYRPKFRFDGRIDTYKPEAVFTTHVNQPQDIELLNGIASDAYKLNIGNKWGTPDWVARKVNRIMLFNRVKLDGNSFSRNADAKIEAAITTPGSPVKFWTLDIKEAYNKDGISISAEGGGGNDSDLTVVYNIDTSAFGDGAGSSNVVQVTKVDND